VSDGDPAPRVEHDPSRRRYALVVGDARVGEIDYRMRGDVVELVHTEVDPALEGQGLGSVLVRGALEDIRARGLRAIPSCPFVAAYIRRHAEFESLVAARP
jgi:uncharacterized protein